ncbi:MAG TPA: FtsX-like permease family protein [Mycobacteriales bacterium]|nr:FtsX-like permease family protein [Mycobacteriales bacterium]
MTARRLVTLRLAWRLVRFAPARSALIAVLVAIPVLAGAFVATAIRTGQLSPGQAADRNIGQADAVAVATPYRQLDPTVSHVGFGSAFGDSSVMSLGASAGGGPDRDGTAVDLPALLPPGTHAVPAEVTKPVHVTTAHRGADVDGVLLDLTDPVTRGLYDISTGRAPAGAGEVAVTGPLASRLHLSTGDRLTVAGRPSVVTAIVRDPSSLSSEAVIAGAQVLGNVASFHSAAFNREVTWLLTFPGAALAPDLHDALATHGVIYETRQQWEHPPAELRASVHVDAQVAAVLTSIVLFGLAEIVLLAGTAFAVGARRQVRDLGLLRAVGGDETDVRRAVLHQGVLLGGAGAVLGAGAGVSAVFFARPLLERFADRAFGPLDARPVEILAVALIGVVAGFLAAVVPARTSARLPIVDMLRTRFPVDGGVVRNARWAWAALVVGPAVIVLAAAGWHRTLGTSGAVSVLGGYVSYGGNGPGHDALWTAVLSGGAAVTLAGLARSCPSLLTRLGRLARRFPLSLRLATRDAARHRHRCAPAAAAVATVVAGAVLTLFVMSSTDLRDRRSYTPGVPVGDILVTTAADSTAAVNAAARRVAAVVGGDTVLLQQARLPRTRSDSSGRPVVVPPCAATTAAYDLCADGVVGVADARTLAALVGHPLPAAAAALARGAVVVPTSASHVAVPAEIRIARPSSHSGHASTLPTYVLTGAPRFSSMPESYVSVATAAEHGWRIVATGALVRPDRLPSADRLDRLERGLGNDVGIYAERGYQTRFGVVLLALIAGTALATLIGTAIAVALAMAESRADLATLAAVGASPVRRRLHAMAQAGALGALGTVLGLGLGCLTGGALVAGSTSYPMSVPFGWLAALAAAAPTLGVLVAGAVTRSRVPLTRRLT